MSKEKPMDALTLRTKRARRRTIRLKIGCILICIFLILVIIFRFVIGIAYYQGTTLAPDIPNKSKIIYSKLTRQYNSDDFVVFEVIETKQVMLRHVDDYNVNWKTKFNQTKILGKVVWHF